jgi:hypothetical protein
MVDCHACSWRLLRAICRDGPLTPIPRFNPRNSALRSYSYNASAHERRQSPQDFENGFQPPVRIRQYFKNDFKNGSYNAIACETRSSGQKQYSIQDIPLEQRQKLAVALPNSNSKFDIERSSVHNHLKRELPWLKDPLKLLERTKTLLEEGNQFKALELVRMASKEGQVTICWNRIIQHLLLNQQASEALKVYNEVWCFSHDQYDVADIVYLF